MLVVHLYRLGSRVLPFVPEPLIYGTCELLGLLILFLATGIRRQVLANLRHVAPQRQALGRLILAQQIIANVLKHYTDLMRLPQMPAAELARRIELCGIAQLRQVLAAGKGAILAAPHCGSYSVIIAALAEQDWRMTLVVERVKPPEMLEVLNGLRRRKNLNIVPLGADAGREVLRALRRGELVVLAADRDLAGQHIVVPFFGKPAPLPAGPAVLACRGVPILTAFTARIAGRRSLGYVEPLTLSVEDDSCVEAVTRQIARRLEDYIGRFPESWGVLQPVWPERQALCG